MFIEKYQPYTELYVKYGENVYSRLDPITIPSVIVGNVKIDLDVVGYSTERDETNLPFTRNNVTWWLGDFDNNVLTKELQIEDKNHNVLTITIEDSGTLNLYTKTSIDVGGTELPIACMLGQPKSLDISDAIDENSVFGSARIVFTGGGGGGNDITVTIQTVNLPTQTLTGQYTEEYGMYYSSFKLADLDESIINGISYSEDQMYYIFTKSSDGMFDAQMPYKTIDGVEIYITADSATGEILCEAFSETEFTVTVTADTIDFYRATSDVVDTFGERPLITDK